MPDFFVYWAGFSGASAAITGTAALARVAAKGGHEFIELTVEQSVFIVLREGHDALERYRVTGLLRDRRRAEDVVLRLRPRSEYGHPHTSELHFIVWLRDTAYLAQRFPYIQFSDHTAAILRSFGLLVDRVIPRVKEDKDLDVVANVLLKLSQFVYAFLPEHANRIEPEAVLTLQNQGMEVALECYEQMKQLPEIRSGPAESERHSSFPRRSFELVLSGVQSPNPLLRFSIWFAVLVILTAAMVFPVSAILSLRASIIVPLFVSTPLICAATLTVTTR